MREPIRDVRRTWFDGLCMGCGTCQSVCPVDAIDLQLDVRRGVYRPSVDVAKCTQCGVCLEACPGSSVDFASLGQRSIDGAECDARLGSFDACFVAWAHDHGVRYEGASGGVASALLIHALGTKRIDGALVLGMSGDNGLLTEPMLASDAELIRAASGSKYCPAATNAGLRRLLEREGRFAVVGLPCHIHAVRKLERIDERVRQRIALRIGLFCANTNTYLGTQYFLTNQRIASERVKAIRYRSEGWPGKIRIDMKEGEPVIIPRAISETKWYRKALFASAFHYDFMVPRCLLCPDQTSELADVSVGDPWLEEYKAKDTIGHSFVIARNRTGHSALMAARDAGAIHLELLPLGKARRAQNFRFKETVGSRLWLRRRFGLPIPEYGDRALPVEWRGILSSVRYLPSYVSHHRWLWPLIRCFSLAHYVQREILRRAKAPIRVVLRRLGARAVADPEGETTAVGGIDNRKRPAATKILLIGARLCRNLGGPSLLLATREVLNRALGEVKYTYVTEDCEDLELAEGLEMDVICGAIRKELIASALAYRLLGVAMGSAPTRRLLRAYAESELIIDIWGIGFSDALGPDTFRSRVLSGTRLLIGRILRKEVVKYTADLGPFEGRWNRLFSRFYLQHAVDLILARSEVTAKRLQQLRLRTPVRVLPDTAFLLTARGTKLSESLGRESQDRPIIGLSVSHMAARKSGRWDQYLDTMAQFADAVATRRGAKVVLIPNEVSAIEAEDDVHVARAIRVRMEAAAECALVDAAMYSAAELKGIIGVCDVMVAARYHTIVASLSQAIPVLAVGWHAKYEGLMGLFDLSEHVLPVDQLDLEYLLRAFERVWTSREEIAEGITQQLPGVVAAVLHGGDLVKELLLR